MLKRDKKQKIKKEREIHKKLISGFYNGSKQLSGLSTFRSSKAVVHLDSIYF